MCRAQRVAPASIDDVSEITHFAFTWRSCHLQLLYIASFCRWRLRLTRPTFLFSSRWRGPGDGISRTQSV